MATGPTTPEGKAVAALNSVTHGLRTQAIVIPDVESQEEWEAFRDEVVSGFEPIGVLEEALAQRVAEVLWRLRRITRAERELTIRRRAMQQIASPIYGPVHDVANEVSLVDLLPPAAHMPDSKTLDTLVRYEAHLNRQLYQAMHELEARKDRRDGLPAPLARLDVAHAEPGS